MKEELRQMIGPLPSESGFKQRMRFHQSWWRAFVLSEEPGSYSAKREEKIGNRLANGKESGRNFLSASGRNAVNQTILERRLGGSGLLEQGRLFNNLLSSQPLCFNFFGELKFDTDFALQVLRQFWSEITEVRQVLFEFAPVQNYTNDNSAFDVAFEVMAGGQSGLIGLECKYTDNFSQKVYDKAAYRRIYEASKVTVFAAGYEEFTAGKFNQLFRNQLIAEALVQHNAYDFTHTGLFCHPEDASARQTGAAFQRMLKNGEQTFRVITYRELIEAIQKLDIAWERREWSMLLWARYCGTQLSEQVYSDR
jgi:hypothetical protein